MQMNLLRSTVDFNGSYQQDGSGGIRASLSVSSLHSPPSRHSRHCFIPSLHGLGLEVHTPAAAVRHLLAVLDQLTPDAYGGFFDWRGPPVPG